MTSNQTQATRMAYEKCKVDTKAFINSQNDKWKSEPNEWYDELNKYSLKEVNAKDKLRECERKEKEQKKEGERKGK